MSWRFPFGRAALLLGLILAVTACTSSPAGGSAPVPTTTAQPTSTATPTPEGNPDVAAIGEIYLGLAAAGNAAVCDFNRVLADNAAPLEQLTAAAAAWAPSQRAFADGLRAITWPAALEADAHELIRALAAQEAIGLAAAEAPTLADFNATFAELETANAAVGAASNLLRGDLGLPSISGDPCE